MADIDRVTPGDILLEEFLEPLGVSRNRLAADLRVSAQTVGRIVKGERSITPDMAIRLSEYFGTTAEFWLNLQRDHDLRVARDTRRAQKIRNEVRPRSPAQA
jgi:addiction module HigA family antidote